MRNKFLKFLSVAVLSTLSLNSIAEESKAVYSVETDPATFAWDGYALHLRMTPANMPHWVFGAGIYSLEFPDFMIDMNDKNKDKNWNASLKQGLGLFGEYYFNPSNEGWLVGAQLAKQSFEISKKNNASNKEKFSNALLMVHGGYRWFPTKKNLYIQPWAGLGYTKKISGSTRVNADSYDVDPVLLFVTMHVGYRF